jgi:peroxiredoxin Q/BCP
MSRAGILSVVVLWCISGLAAGAGGPVVLKVGDQAPLFSLPGSDGRTYTLADYRGKQVVVLAWCAKAFTSG